MASSLEKAKTDMGSFTGLIDLVTLGSRRPMRRLLAYYVIMGVVVAALLYFFPIVGQAFSGGRLTEMTDGPQLLQDALGGGVAQRGPSDLRIQLELALSTTLTLLGILALLLPVTWVYMSIRRSKGHDQAFVQTLIILPIVVAAIVMVVRNSVALAFSLAGVVAAVRFRTTLNDSRDVVFIFVAIAIGFAAGVQVNTLAVVLSIVFNFVLLLTWRYDFGRNVLEPVAAAAPWAQPLNNLALLKGVGSVPDRDLVLALSQKEIGSLADRFARVRHILGPQGKKPRFNAVLSVTTDKTPEAQERVGGVLDEVAGRWRLDEIKTHDGKPSQMYYLVLIRKSMTRDDLITSVRAGAIDSIIDVEVEIEEELAAKVEKMEKAENKA